MQLARNEGYQTGHTEATNDLTQALENRLANTLDSINAQVANLFDAFAADKEEHSRDAVAVATVIIRKLFPALNMDKALSEITHMIKEAMQRTSGVPSLIIRVAPELRDAIESKSSEMAALRGREGTITVMADETLIEGDAAIEWDGGGMVRDSKLMWQEIDEIIERNLGTERANGSSFDGAVNSPADEHAELPPTDAHDTPAITPNEASEIMADQRAEDDKESVQEVVNEAPVRDNTQTRAESPEDPLPQAMTEDEIAVESIEETTPENEHLSEQQLGELTPTDDATGEEMPDDTDNEG